MNKELFEKLKILQEYDNAYYNGTPLVSDIVYDKFKDSVITQLPPDHEYLDKVGHAPVSLWPKETHTIHMGSQNKVSNEQAIKEWYEKVQKELGINAPEFILQHKIDGFSLECVYERGMLEKGVTRGNGTIGENITQNVKMFRNVPNYVAVDKKVAIRGEGVIFKEDFDNLQKKTGNHFKNARNAAAGVSRRYDGKNSTFVRLVSYDINAKVKKESEKIAVLKKLGFNTVQTYVCNSLNDILCIYREYKKIKRTQLPYDIDGLVLKLNDIDLQEKMGIKHNRPEGQIALKFDSDQSTTTIKNIFCQVGRTGRLTPVASLEPTELMGSTVTKASLHNFAEIERLLIGVGAEVTVEKKGDIIPQVVDVVSSSNLFKKPIICPSCGGSLIDDNVNLWCKNDGCREREVNRIRYWAEVIDLKGFSIKFIEKLWDMGKIKNVADIYKLQADDFAAIDGIGEKTVKSFFSKLQETSEMYLDKFITALGIPHCSKSTATIFMDEFHSWEKISQLSASEVASLPGFAETSASIITEGIKEIRDMAESLLKVIKIKEKKKGILTDKSFCVTGSLVSMGRKEFGELVVEHGGTIKNSVGAGLTYLVTNDPSSGSSKNRAAKKHGVEVITEEQFFDLLGEKKELQNKKSSYSENIDAKKNIEYENIFDL